MHTFPFSMRDDGFRAHWRRIVIVEVSENTMVSRPLPQGVLRLYELEHLNEYNDNLIACGNKDVGFRNFRSYQIVNICASQE